MTTDVVLPALDGRDPLGFLAALGVLRVIGDGACLSFSDQTGVAILTSSYSGADAVASALVKAAEAIPEGCVLEGVGPRFPLRKQSRKRARKPGSSQKDPMRVARVQYRDQLHAVVTSIGSPAALGWLAVLVTDLGIDNEGRAEMTPFSAPTGQQSCWTFFEKSLDLIRANPGHLAEALTGWTRVEGFSGEYLDHRVLNSGADHPTGKSTEFGVPGATWLAIQALPLLRLTGNGKAVASTLWHRVNGRRSVMLWPLWNQPLDQAAVRILLEHPLLKPKSADGGTPKVDRSNLDLLGIFDVCGAERLPVPLRKGKGILTPLRISC